MAASDTQQLVIRLFHMMSRIDHNFVESIQQEMEAKPIQMLGRMDVVEHIPGPMKTSINGVDTLHYAMQYSPVRFYDSWLRGLLIRLGITRRHFTGAEARVSIGGKTIAVAKNVSYSLGAKIVPPQSNGRFVVSSSDDGTS